MHLVRTQRDELKTIIWNECFHYLRVGASAPRLRTCRHEEMLLYVYRWIDRNFFYSLAGTDTMLRTVQRQRRLQAEDPDAVQTCAPDCHALFRSLVKHAILHFKSYDVFIKRLHAEHYPFIERVQRCCDLPIDDVRNAIRDLSAQVFYEANTYFFAGKLQIQAIPWLSWRCGHSQPQPLSSLLLPAPQQEVDVALTALPPLSASASALELEPFPFLDKTEAVPLSDVDEAFLSDIKIEDLDPALLGGDGVFYGGEN